MDNQKTKNEAQPTIQVQQIVRRAVIDKDIFEITIGRPLLEQNNIKKDDLPDIVKSIWGGELFYNDGKIKCTHSINKFAYILTQQELRCKYECGHAKEVRGPCCPICNEPNIVIILPEHA